MSAVTSLICVVDDEPLYKEALATFLMAHGHQVASFDSAADFLKAWPALGNCDLLLSDINMPVTNGFDLCKSVRAQETAGRLPIILMTGSDPRNEKAMGLDAGADDFIGKPVSTKDLLAKVRSLLNIRAREIETRTQLNVAHDHNTELSTKLKDQFRRTNRLEQLRQFLSPNIAHLLTLDDQHELLKPHRAEVTVVFFDLRRFTTFSEKAEPEEVLEVLGEYYTAVGNAAIKHKGTLGHLAGDGVMVFFNDPEPILNHTEVAINMALEARESLLEKKLLWEERQHDIDFGIGVSVGYATIGGIGFDCFSQYTVIGTVTNLASRLCNIAGNGQILISQRVLSVLQDCEYEVESLGNVTVKGIEKPLPVSNVVSFKKKSQAA